MSTPPNLTALISKWQNGDAAALEQLTPYVYDEMRRLARRQMRREKPGHTLQATAVVNEVFLKLAGADVDYKSRAHFYKVAAQMMRRILVDHARAKHRAKRGGHARDVTFDETSMVCNEDEFPDVLDLDIALNKLATFDSRLAHVVELIYFGGLTYEETATVLGVSRTKVYEDLQFSKAWLQKELGS